MTMAARLSYVLLTAVSFSGCQVLGPESGFLTVQTDREIYHANSQATVTITNESPSPLFWWTNCSQVDSFLGPPVPGRGSPTIRPFCHETTDWPPPERIGAGESVEIRSRAGWGLGPGGRGGGSGSGGEQSSIVYRIQLYVSQDVEGRRPVPIDESVSNPFTVWYTPAVWVAQDYSGGRQCDPSSRYEPPDVRSLLETHGVVVMETVVEPGLTCGACSCPAYAARHYAQIREKDLEAVESIGFERHSPAPW